jgi:hypothetical protein
VALHSIYGNDEFHGQLSPEMRKLYEGVFLQRRRINQSRHLPTQYDPVVLTEEVEADTPVESPSQPVRKQHDLERRLSLEEMARRGKPKPARRRRPSPAQTITALVRPSKRRYGQDS